jgi:hypothetical protein
MSTERGTVSNGVSPYSSINIDNRRDSGKASPCLERLIVRVRIHINDGTHGVLSFLVSVRESFPCPIRSF